ncbi:MAG: glucosamine-6-phosphate isomerase [Tepidisphaeraceae bacterium]
MPHRLNMLNTIRGSQLEGFYPKGWDLRRIDRCCGMNLKQLTKPAKHWNRNFNATPVKEIAAPMGNAIAEVIERTRREGRKLAIILPVGPVVMYKTVVRRLRLSATRCDHVTTFNMDEWADRHGNSMPGNQPGGFEYTMGQCLFDRLGKLTVPKSQRNFATKQNLPTYAEKICKLKADGATLVTVYGIGRTCHIAFWEPHLADGTSLAMWKRQTHRIGVSLHPLTIEQNSLHSFNSRFTLIPCWANTIGPGLFLQSDWCIGGAEGAYPEYGAQWQGMSTCVTLQHGPTPWLTATFMPTLPGRLFFTHPLAGPLLAE